MEATTKQEQFEEFRKDVKRLLGDAFVGEVGPDRGQFAFCTSEPDRGETAKAEHIDAILQAKDKYGALARCAVMPFGVSGRIIYVVAGL